MDNWQKIYSTRNPAEASIIQGMLEENQIPVQLLNKQDSIYLFGDLQIYVPIQYLETAKQLLNNTLLN
jgi:Putative prokaryotic signal transducing protein